jgi:hypothetical protein
MEYNTITCPRGHTNTVRNIDKIFFCEQCKNLYDNGRIGYHSREITCMEGHTYYTTLRAYCCPMCINNKEVEKRERERALKYHLIKINHEQRIAHRRIIEDMENHS